MSVVLLMHFEDAEALLFVVMKLHLAGERSPAVSLILGPVLFDVFINDMDA